MSQTPTLLHQLFWRAAQATPQAVALEFPPGPGRATRQTLTYGEVAERATRLAAALASGEVGPGVRRERVVAILLPRETPDPEGSPRTGRAAATPDHATSA